MNPIVKFFHELLHPHCEHCTMESEIKLSIERESRRCDSCESLRMQVAILNEQNKNLIDKIVNPYPQPIVNVDTVLQKPIHRGPIPFSAIRKHLETESRAAAESLKHAALPDSVIEQRKPLAQSYVENVHASGINDVEALEDMVINATNTRTAEVGTKQ